jgi:hypothetical protein
MSNELVPSGDVASEIATVERTMREAPQDYWRDSGMQTRYRDLIEARDTGVKPPDKPSAVDAEIASIEKLMRTDRREYERSGAADRYLALLRAREGQDEAPAPTDDWRRSSEEARRDRLTMLRQREAEAPATDPDEARRNLSPALVAQLEKSPGGFEHGLQRLQDGLASVLMHIPEGQERVQAIEHFELLPLGAQDAALVELSRGRPFAPPASAAKLAEFRTLPVGDTLIAAWGGAASRRIGTVIARLDRARAGMSVSDRDAFDRYLDFAPPREMIAILWNLAVN